jgi:hypothetical protein
MVSFDIHGVTDDHFMKTLAEELTSQCGEIRFTKLIHEMIWVSFVNNQDALEAVKLGPLKVMIYFQNCSILSHFVLLILPETPIFQNETPLPNI